MSTTALRTDPAAVEADTVRTAQRVADGLSLAARLHGQAMFRAVAVAFGGPEPVLVLDWPHGAPWPDGRHAAYLNGTVYVPDPNDALDLVLAHEMTHALHTAGVLPDAGPGHGPGFYAARDRVLTVFPCRWQTGGPVSLPGGPGTTAEPHGRPQSDGPARRLRP